LRTNSYTGGEITTLQTLIQHGKPIVTGLNNGSATLIQSNFGKVGNFEVLVATERGLEHWYRDNDAANADTAWAQGNNGKPILGPGIAGFPALIQSNFDIKGNFEVLINTTSGLEHWYRDNDAANADTAWAQGNNGKPITQPST
jgi:hypothetical protein